MSTNQFSRREVLKAGALPSVAAFLNLSFGQNAAAQTQSTAGRATNNIIRLWGNENPYGPPPKARQAIIEAALAGNRYAGVEIGALEKSIAEREGVTPESVIIGSGSGEVLAMAAVAYGLERGEIVTADPTFLWLMRYAEFLGAKILRVPLDQNRAHDLRAMSGRVGANTKLVYVCNPNNPTATIVSSNQLRSFCEDTADRAPVLVDEAYLEYTNDFPASSMIDLVRKGQNIIVLRTFSKIYGLAGIRLGYGLAKPEIAARLKQFRMTWLNPVSLKAGLAALQEIDFVHESRRKNFETRRHFLAEMDKLKIASAESHANFVWLSVGANQRDLPVKLAKYNIYTAGLNPRPLGGDSMRVTIGTTEEMQALARAMQTIYKN